MLVIWGWKKYRRSQNQAQAPLQAVPQQYHQVPNYQQQQPLLSQQQPIKYQEQITPQITQSSFAPIEPIEDQTEGVPSSAIVPPSAPPIIITYSSSNNNNNNNDINEIKINKEKHQHRCNKQLTGTNRNYSPLAYLCNDCGFGNKKKIIVLSQIVIAGLELLKLKHICVIIVVSVIKKNNCVKCGKWLGGPKHIAYLCTDHGFGSKADNCISCNSWTATQQSTREVGYLCNKCNNKHDHCVECDSHVGSKQYVAYLCSNHSISLTRDRCVKCDTQVGLSKNAGYLCNNHGFGSKGEQCAKMVV